MLLTMTRNRLGLFLILLAFVSVSSKQAQASRFVIPDDNDVLKVINQNDSLDYVIQRDDIKILVWNMYKAGKKSWATDYRKLIKGIDILMLQEVFTAPDMMNVLKEDESRSYFLATSFKDKKRNFARTGTATASSF